MMRQKVALGRRVKGAFGALGLAAALLTSGCLSGPLSEGNAAQVHLERKVFAISCDEGRRYAAKTMQARNYELTGVDRSGPQTTVGGTNSRERLSGKIVVECGADGVMVYPSGNSQWVVDGLRFSFYQLVEAGDRIWPPPTSPVVKMELYGGLLSKIAFPVDLEPLGMVAVRVRVVNAGERALRLDPRRMHVVTAAGAEALALAPADVERKLALADPDIKSKLLQATKLKHGETVVGFVFFPAGAYSGASLALIDEKTSEADDYDVTFGSG